MGGRYQAYAEYKSAGVEFLDLLPADWRVMRGKFVFSEFRERSTSGTETLLSVSEYYGVKPRGEVIADGDFLSRAESLIDYKKCQKNDLVMNIMLAWKRGLGVTKYDGIVSPAYSVFRFNESANPDYMHYLLRTETYTDHFKTRSTGVIDSRLRLYPESFGHVPIILPPVDQQGKIANFLDHETAKIDTLIEKQQQLIKLLKEKRQAVISHAVTKGLNPNAPMRDSGVEWLGEVPEHWDVKKFTHCASIRNGQVDPRKEPYCDFTLIAPNHIESGTGRLIAQETAAKQGADSGKYLCKEGEVIYSKIRPALAKVCISPSDNTICSADMYPIQGISGLTNEFLFWSLLSTWFTSLVILESDRVAMPKINREKLAEVMLPVPPEKEQKEIVTEVRNKTKAMDSLIQKAEKAITLAKERRTALISAAVTGKIDVRNWQAPEPSDNQNKKVA